MQSTTPFRATGMQIAILIFAVVFLAYPIDKYAGPLVGLPAAGDGVTSRVLIFVPAFLVLTCIPSIRRIWMKWLRARVIPGRLAELGAVAMAKALVPFAVAGAIALWYWAKGGEMALARRIGSQRSLEAELTQALGMDGMLLLFLAVLVAPVIEELVFRGFLYRAWEAQWGWFRSMLATSIVFAIYHPVPLAAFVGSILFVTVMRRTGTIWAAILVHAVGNLALWPPLMGQFYFRTAGKETGEIGLWWLHLAALAVLLLALPLYVWMSRDRGAAAADEDLDEDAAAARC